MAVCPHRVHAWLGTAGQLEDNHLIGNCFPSTVGSIYKMNCKGGCILMVRRSAAFSDAVYFLNIICLHVG